MKIWAKIFENCLCYSIFNIIAMHCGGASFSLCGKQKDIDRSKIVFDGLKTNTYEWEILLDKSCCEP